MKYLQSTFFRGVSFSLFAIGGNLRAISFGFIGCMVFLSLANASMAQAPGWSRGQQNLAISYDECLRRASAALQGEGYRIDYAGGNFAVGIKGVHTGVIICSPAPESKMLVHIVVASNGDGGGVERQRLQARMEGSGSGSVGGGGVSGTWDLVCCSNKYRSILVLQQNGNRLTGYMVNPEQKLEGSINGNTLRFTRNFSGGSQEYALTLSPDGRTLTGNFTGTRDTSVGTETTATKRQ